MIKQKNIYYSLEPLISFKILIVFCFIMTLLANPLVSISTNLIETTYELRDTQKKENSSEKEIELKYEDEKLNFYNFSKNSYQTDPKQLLSYFSMQLSILNMNMDILLPPPKA